MILVNNPGDPHSSYSFLRHAKWDGWSFADLIFPFFLFIVGVAIPLSFADRVTPGESRKLMYLHVVKRTIILFGLGLFINSFPFFSISDLRIPGVLQRIAVCYFFSSLIVMNFRIRWHLASAGLLLTLYWAVMMFLPVPHYGAGVLTKEGNPAAYIDNMLLHGHMVDTSFDPEGLLSTIPAVSTTLLGALAGHLLRSSRSPFNKALLLWLSGLGGITAGLIMDIWFPINKNLWSPSYAVFTAGLASICLGVCFWLVEIKSYVRWGRPFEIYGTNAISVYALSSLAEQFANLWTLTQTDGSAMRLRAYIFEKLFASWAAPVNASLYYAMTNVLIWFGFAVILYRKKIFIRI